MNRYRCVIPRVLACVSSVSVFQIRHWVRKIHFLAIGALLSLPLMASAEDALGQGYCGPMPPNSWFQFSSSTVPAVQSQLLSTLTARAFSSYNVAVSKYVADYITPGGCTAQVTPKVSTYCTNPLDCLAQIDGEIRMVCNGQSYTPFLNTFAEERGGCYWAYAPAPAPKKVVVIDPGHGFNCPANGMAIGAIGVTDFAPNNPPAGPLREDELTMAIALQVRQQMSPTKFNVILTKTSVNACPTFLDRGRIANNHNAKAFVSVHINAANVIPGTDVSVPIANGTSVLYNSAKSGSFNLADDMARAVSSNLGVNNRGVRVDDGLAVLKPTVTRMNAVLLEAARLSGRDEEILHSSSAAARAAAGIQSALEWNLPN